MLLGDAHSFVSLGLRYDAPLNLDLVLTVGRRLVSQTLFKCFASLVFEPIGVRGRAVPLVIRHAFEATLNVFLVGRGGGRLDAVHRWAVLDVSALGIREHVSGHFL